MQSGMLSLGLYDFIFITVYYHMISIFIALIDHSMIVD